MSESVDIYRSTMWRRLSVRVRKLARRFDIKYPKDLAKLSELDVLATKNAGPGTLREIQEYLHSRNKHLMETPIWPRPIPVSERLPEINEDDVDGVYASDFVLAFYSGQWYAGMYYLSECKWHLEEVGVCRNGVTHWLPMPPDPE